MESPRERVPEKDGEDRFEDVPSEEEPKAPKDDATTALEWLLRLKLGAKGSSKGEAKGQEQEQEQRGEETQSKKKGAIKSTTKQWVGE